MPDFTVSTLSIFLSVLYVSAFLCVPLALLRSRTPQGATAWCISLISFPFLALPLFLLFGRSKFKDSKINSLFASS